VEAADVKDYDDPALKVRWRGALRRAMRTPHARPTLRNTCCLRRAGVL
jgi:hypothetical protein